MHMVLFLLELNCIKYDISFVNNTIWLIFLYFFMFFCRKYVKETIYRVSVPSGSDRILLRLLTAFLGTSHGVCHSR